MEEKLEGRKGEKHKGERKGERDAKREKKNLRE